MSDDEGDEAELESEDEALKEDVNEFLTAWGANNDKRRKRLRASVNYEPRRAYPGFQFTETVRHQHIVNLVACMRHFEATRDDASLSAVLGTLLQAEHPKKIGGTWLSRGKPATTRMSEILMATYNLMRRNPGSAGIEQLQRLLRRTKLLQSSNEGKSAVEITLGQMLLEEGHSADAYDALKSISAPEGSRELFECEMLLAGIRHKQWLDAMHAASGSSGATRGPSITSPQSQPFSQRAFSQQQMSQAASQGGKPWRPFTHSTSVWARAGRGARDLCQDAQGHNSTALQLKPGCTGAALSLVEAAIAQGKRIEALEVARQQCKSAPFDADAHGMLLSLLISDRKKSGNTVDQDVKIMQQCCSFLRCSGGADSAAAANVLISIGEQALSQGSLAPVELLLEGLCTYLDTLPPLLNCSGIALQCWKLFADALVSVCQSCVAAFRAAEEVRSAVRHAKEGGDSDEIDAAQIEMQRAHACLQNAMNGNYAAQRVLQSRAWWLECHVQMPQKASKVTKLLQDSDANAETLVAVAVVQTAMLQSVEAQQGREVRLGLALPTPPRANQSGGVVVQALHQIGEEQAAERLCEMLSIVRMVPGMMCSVEESSVSAISRLASWAQVSSDDLDLHSDWVPHPLGAPHPEMGILADMPEQWWSVFPQVRRKARGEQQTATELREPLRAATPLPLTQPATQRRVRFLLPGTQADSALGAAVDNNMEF